MRLQLKTAILLIVLLQGISIFGQMSATADCKRGHDPRSNVSYGIEVWKQIFPIEKGTHPVTITIEEGYLRKFVLRAYGPDQFKVFRYEPKEYLFTTLQNLADNCKLPEDPKDAARMMDQQWEALEIDKPQFERIHRGFMEAMKWYMLDAESRYRSALIGDVGIMIHATRWKVNYDNDGYEDMSAIVDARKDKGGNLLPFPLWVHDTIDYLESIYKSSKNLNPTSSKPGGWRTHCPPPLATEGGAASFPVLEGCEGTNVSQPSYT
jgi:hypothetical protein